MAVTLSNYHLKFDDIRKIVFEDSQVAIEPNTSKKIEDSYHFLKNFAQDKLIYGINTGFGPMAQYRIDDEQQQQLQYNLIRSHSSGLGQHISQEKVRAVMLARLNSLLKGNSGVHPELINLLSDFINRGIYPLIYEHGSVGASGDLVQLSHLALSLIGEGKVMYKGEIVPTKTAMEEEGLQPLKMHLREGLALINGTSAMTGVGVVNLLNAQNLFNWAVVASAMIIELVESYDDHYSTELNKAKLHHGQQYVAGRIKKILSDSQLTRKRQEHLYKKITETNLKDKVQEYYSIRCVPQILGPVYDTLQEAIKVLVNEINSVSDNPVIDPQTQNVYHGGNFHGDYVSLEMDKLKIAITRLSMLAERQLNFLLNDKLNQKLPPFANLGTLGLNLGMQGAQFVATSTVAENQTLSYPMYLHSIPNNNDNQDIVSMGTNSALIASKVIENTYQVLAVQILTVIQSVEYLGMQDRMSELTRGVYEKIRKLVPTFSEDTIMNEKLNRVKSFIFRYHIQLEESASASSSFLKNQAEEIIEMDVCPV